MHSRLSFPFARPIKGSFLPSYASSKPAANGSESAAGPSGSSIPLKRKAADGRNPMPPPPPPPPQQQQAASQDDTISFKLPPGVSEEAFFAFLNQAGMPGAHSPSILGGPSQFAPPNVGPPLPTNIPASGMVPVAAVTTSDAAAEPIEVDDDDDDPSPAVVTQPTTTSIVPAGSRAGPLPAPKKGGNGIIPRIADFVQRVRMLTGTIPNPSTVMAGCARDLFLRGLEVGATLIQTRTERGTLAMQMCRLWVEHKARTDEELFARERFDAYVEFVDRCIFPAFKQMAGVFDGDVSAEDMPDDDVDTEAAISIYSGLEPAPRRRGRPPKPKAEKEKEKEKDDENPKDKKKPKPRPKAKRVDLDGDDVIDIDD